MTIGESAAQNCLDFMQSFGKFEKIVSPLELVSPPPGSAHDDSNANIGKRHAHTHGE